MPRPGDANYNDMLDPRLVGTPNDPFAGPRRRPRPGPMPIRPPGMAPGIEGEIQGIMDQGLNPNRDAAMAPNSDFARPGPGPFPVNPVQPPGGPGSAGYGPEYGGMEQAFFPPGHPGMPPSRPGFGPDPMPGPDPSGGGGFPALPGPGGMPGPGGAPTPFPPFPLPGGGGLPAPQPAPGPSNLEKLLKGYGDLQTGTQDALQRQEGLDAREAEQGRQEAMDEMYGPLDQAPEPTRQQRTKQFHGGRRINAPPAPTKNIGPVSNLRRTANGASAGQNF